MSPATYMVALAAISVARQQMSEGKLIPADQMLEGLYSLIAAYAAREGVPVPSRDPINMPAHEGLQ